MPGTRPCGPGQIVQWGRLDRGQIRDLLPYNLLHLGFTSSTGGAHLGGSLIGGSTGHFPVTCDAKGSTKTPRCIRAAYSVHHLLCSSML